MRHVRTGGKGLGEVGVQGAGGGTDIETRQRSWGSLATRAVKGGD